ncbi:MAG: NlpC/P60 family protein [Bilifractor sp.]
MAADNAVSSVSSVSGTSSASSASENASSETTAGSSASSSSSSSGNTSSSSESGQGTSSENDSGTDPSSSGTASGDASGNTSSGENQNGTKDSTSGQSKDESSASGTSNQNTGTADQTASEQNNGSSVKNDTASLPVTDTGNETPESDSDQSGQAGNAVTRTPTGSRTVVAPEYVKVSNYRFETVGKTPVVAAQDMDIYMSRSTSARAAGHIQKYGILYKLKDTGDGWLYVESGEVRGFIPASSIKSEAAARHVIAAHYRNGNARTDEDKAVFDWSPYYAQKTAEIWENEAFTFTNTTTREALVKKDYLITTAAANITEQKDANSTVIGTIPANGLLYRIADTGDGWLYVESGDCRGFIPKSSVRGGRSVSAEVAASGEGSYASAQLKVSPKDNKAFYYSLSSVTAYAESTDLGASIIKNASYYIGNNYVWGGTSLTDGADCSGFVQTLYNEFGISLPRVAQAQAQVGEKVSLEDAVPGDLCFFMHASTGEIYHVAIYAGDGKTIEAYSSSRGIIATNVYTPDLCWCTHVLPDPTEDKAALTSGDSVSITPDTVAGGQYGYGTWDKFCTHGTTEQGLMKKYGTYDSEGFGKISGRYVISCSASFGKVGDLIDFTLSNGQILKTVVGSNMAVSDNQWGLASGRNAISFMVAGRTWKDGHKIPGSADFHPEWNATITTANNYGSILG